MWKRTGKGRSEFVRRYVTGKIILDVGCAGSGGFIMHKVIVTRNKSSLIVGLDISLGRLKERLALNSKLVLADAEHLPFRSASFDCVYMGEIIEHFWYSRQLLEEVCRVLKDNGILCLDTPNVYSIERILRFVLKGKDSLGESDHKIFYSPASISKLLEDVGFAVITITTDAKIVSFMGKVIFLDCPPFRWLGSHLCIAARKSESP